ncbi:hypothetical protein [Salinicoccus halodurans]|uniref:Uncharacterized protein n=1 Tax=Salinicoccus halodurans TaxID=407035 RepID=A0A0F7HK65_9STAP|nr:hypothetical protein [Salinicoccus halodurans]AKG74271.1 hypothetical protein AAT16_08525 [Salinicoccus halodurans]SFK93823.1 hypothetical protein SAMN05216235_2602 [Salinicoccus halodurans]
MTIIVKVKDSTNNETNFRFIRSDKVKDSIKTEYINQEMTQRNNSKFVQFIYPNHTETFTQFKIDYKRR